MLRSIYNETSLVNSQENYDSELLNDLADAIEETVIPQVTAEPLAEYGESTLEAFERYLWEVHRKRLYHYQRIVAKAYLEMDTEVFRRLAIKSGHSVGKTTLFAWLADFEFSCLMFSILTSAPGKEQVKDGIWKEILARRQTAQRALPGAYLRSPEIRVEDDASWFARGIFSNEPERVQGKKHPRLRVYLDESSGFPEWYWDAVDSSMSSGNTKMAALGNPIHADGRFRKIFTEDKGVWITFTISSLHSPCITCAEAEELWELIKAIDPDLAEECRHQIDDKVEEPWHDGIDPKIMFDGLASFQWVKEKIIEWSGEIDKIRTRILGLFSKEGAKKVFPERFIEAAQRFWLEQEEEELDMIEEEIPPIHRASIDPAGEGVDLMVLSFLRGQRIHYAFATNEPDSTEQTKMVEEWIGSIPPGEKPRIMAVDVTGMGKGLYDQLLKSRKENSGIWGRCRVIKYYANASSNEPMQYRWLVDELHFKLRYHINPRTPYEDRIGIPPDDRVPYIEKYGDEPVFGGIKRCSVTGHFNTRLYKEDSRDRKRVSGKKEIEEMKKKSPDLSDAAAGLFISPKVRKIGIF